MIIEGTIVNSVAAALVELSDIHSVTAVALEGGNVFILFHHTTWGKTSKMFTANCKKNNVELIRDPIV